MEERQMAYIFAIKTLTRRDHSEAELRRKMGVKGISSGAVDETIERLKNLGYLDDRRFALRWAESAARNGKGYGSRLRFELNRRGIDEETAAEVTELIRAEFDETETIEALVSRKFATFTPKDADDRRKRRVINYLQRRGFSLSAILQVFRDLEKD
jgi:regulatory protein